MCWELYKENQRTENVSNFINEQIEGSLYNEPYLIYSIGRRGRKSSRKLGQVEEDFILEKPKTRSQKRGHNS